MAGLGFKDFQVGEVLTSSDVDGYLMQQTVMRFADSGSRGSALGTAAGTGVALAEGMVTYLDDTNTVQVYNGTEWTSPVAGIGNNIVQTVKTDTFTTTNTSMTDITGLSVTITPSNSTSKVLVIAQVNISGSSAGGVYWDVTGGNMGTYIGDAASNRTRTLSSLAGPFGDLPRFMIASPGIYLDSPASASSITYQVRIKTGSATNTVYVNRSGNDSDSADWGRGASSITAIEVAG